MSFRFLFIWFIFRLYFGSHQSVSFRTEETMLAWLVTAHLEPGTADVKSPKKRIAPAI